MMKDGSMPLRFTCPKCNRDIIVKHLSVGERAQCKSCMESVTIPATAESVGTDCVPRQPVIVSSSEIIPSRVEVDESLASTIGSIKAEIPKSAGPDIFALVFGIVFVVMGVWLVDLGGTIFGPLFVIVGGVSVLTGCATIVWKSAKVKLVQAVNSFAMTCFLVGMQIRGGQKQGLFSSPLLFLGLVAGLGWLIFSYLQDYSRLSKLEQESPDGNKEE